MDRARRESTTASSSGLRQRSAPQAESDDNDVSTTSTPSPTVRTMGIFIAKHTEILSPSDPSYPPADTVCVICQDPFDDTHYPTLIIGIPGCQGHIFGHQCLKEAISSMAPNSNKCPLCRTTWFEMSRETLRAMGLEQERVNEENLRQMLLQEERMEDIETEGMLREVAMLREMEVLREMAVMREVAVRFRNQPRQTRAVQAMSRVLVASLVGGLVMIVFMAWDSAVSLSAMLASRR